MYGQVEFSWEIHRTCNFRCPYCWHFGKWDELSKQNVYPGVEKLIKVWKRMYDLYGECILHILGGEPSIYPNINELLLELIKYHKIFLTTNLSNGFDKLLDCIPEDLINKINISTTFHPMFSQLDEFLPKVKKIKSKICNCVLYLAYPPHLKDLLKYKKIFEDNGLNFSVLTFWGIYDGKKYPDSYTDEEKKLIGINIGSRNGENFQTEPFVPTGKLCNAGHKYGNIQPDGKVLACGGASNTVKVDFIGNIFDPDFKLLDKPMVCPARTCPCNEWAKLLVR